MQNTILVVENHGRTRNVLQWLLNVKGYAVVTARSLSEALTLCKSRELDLLVCNSDCTNQANVDVMRSLVNNCKIKGIAYISAEERANPAEIKKVGVSAYLQKPCYENLVDAIRQLL